MPLPIDPQGFFYLKKKKQLLTNPNHPSFANISLQELK